jgi:hypothetical protein
MSTATQQDWLAAYDAQLDLLRWVRSETGRRFLKGKFMFESEEYSPATRQMLRAVNEAEEGRLEAASPYFVSRDMCRMVEAAAPSFAPEPIFPTDLLSLSGFVYFERPFRIPDRFDRPVSLAAFSWCPLMTDATRPERLLSRQDEVFEWLEERHGQGKVDGLAICLYESSDSSEWPEGAIVPPITPLHFTPWWWGMAFEGNEVTEGGRPTGASWWWKILQTTLRLMQQRITVHHQERPLRSQRRYAKRLNLNERDVTVVTLRRERSQEHGEPLSEFHYSHRFIVGGHWRNQWYPASAVHRQIWIADYEKGPEGAPLIVKPRVYRWTR